jgi:hypothetical protein
VSSPDLRAGDEDRDRTIDVLREAFAQGRLSHREFDERLDSAHGALTFGDLDALIADLPSMAASTPVPLAATEAAVAKERRDMRSAWASWLGVGVLVNIIWFATWMGNGPAPYYWPIWVIGPWGGGMLIWTLSSKAERPRNG